jgi:hypothetical protein
MKPKMKGASFKTTREKKMNRRMQTLEKKGEVMRIGLESSLENRSSLEKFFSRSITNFNIGFPFKGFK